MAKEPTTFINESLYCLEQNNDYEADSSNSLPVLYQHDTFCSDEELTSLLSKEETNRVLRVKLEADPCLVEARNEAVDWMCKVNAHYCFDALTFVLAVNYLDKYLSDGFDCQRKKPWIIQLAAVACLSIAAKVEEVEVPLLLDFQVEESKYYFEARTIQKMEILILSTLQWRMNPVTPLSFLDYITRMIGLKNHYLCSRFHRRCECVIVSILSDSRSLKYAPSVMATAAAMHVINCIEPCLGAEYQCHLMEILGIDKENVEECHKLILEMECESSRKRKYGDIPGSPHGVIGVAFSSDSSNDSWSVSSSVSSSPEPLSMKNRTVEGLNHLSTDLLSVSR